MVTDRDFLFTATDIQTNQIINFTLIELIFQINRTNVNKLHEDMQYDLIKVVEPALNV